MPERPLRGRLPVALLLLLAGAVHALQDVEPPVDARSQELVREACRSQLGLRELTLFANGTVRLREGPSDDPEMWLAEMGPDEVVAFERRIAGIDLSETESSYAGPDGDWVESCRLVLTDRKGGAARELRYDRYATGDLALDNLRRIVADLLELARERPTAVGYPREYEPRFGDRLLRADDIEFVVIGRTSDGRGVELESADGLLSVIVAVEDVKTLFPTFLSAGRRP